MYGLTSEVSKTAGSLPAKKSTGFMTSASSIADELDCICSGDHVHQRIISGRRSRAAQVYPEQLCDAILRGLAKQLTLEESELASSRKVTQQQLSSLLNSTAPARAERKDHWTDTAREDDGG